MGAQGQCRLLRSSRFLFGPNYLGCIEKYRPNAEAKFSFVFRRPINWPEYLNRHLVVVSTFFDFVLWVTSYCMRDMGYCARSSEYLSDASMQDACA